jgi:hypothetical protein
MNKVVLQKIYSSGPGSVHVKLLINNKDVGIIYLKEEEAEVLINCLRQGAVNSDIDFETDIFETEDDYNLDEEE